MERGELLLRGVGRGYDLGGEIRVVGRCEVDKENIGSSAGAIMTQSGRIEFQISPDG